MHFYLLLRYPEVTWLLEQKGSTGSGGEEDDATRDAAKSVTPHFEHTIGRDSDPCPEAP